MPPLKIITTGDGSHSLLNEELNETYHSVHGAIRESLHVFIEHGLSYYHKRTDVSSLSILEIGFGTGLNAWLTLNYAIENDLSIDYFTLEAFPLEETVWALLNYADDDTKAKLFASLHTVPWEKEQAIQSNFKITKMKVLLAHATLARKFDIVYFDAFAPSKQPEMWTLDILDKISNAMNPYGVFVTYCAKGQVKRDLISLGMTTETLPGPPGKKEMIRAIKH